MEQYLNDEESVTWLLETHLQGVILPTKWKDFRSYLAYGNEDCPDKVQLYKSQDATVNDPWFEVVFNRDELVYCTGQECNPVKGQPVPLETEPVETTQHNGVVFERYRGESLRFEKGTPGQVRRAVAELQAAKEVIRVFLGNPSTGQAQPVASLVVGQVVANLDLSPGMAGDWRMPKLQLVKAQNGSRIVELPTPMIVGILRKNGEWAYQHPNLQFGKWAKAYKEDLWHVAHEDKLQAKFRDEQTANKFIKFMTGKSFDKPKRREFL